METKIAAVVLAAGSSSRLGKPKQLLAFEGTTFLRRTVNATMTAGCDPVVVVIGSKKKEIAAEVSTLPISLSVNETWERGMGTSIRAGLSTTLKITPDIDGLILLVCDQPLIGADVLRGLMARRTGTGKTIVAAQYGDTSGVPALFSRSIFDELLALPDESGAKHLIILDPKRVANYPFPEGEIDIDTTADYERFMAGFAGPSAGGTTTV
jgi:molybdenum cofactor cytidylyltransferase